jgi:hypothetical protein
MRRGMKMPRNLICSKHDEIVEICQDIYAMDFDKPFKREMFKKLKRIEKLTGEARKDGQNMEDRLGEYYWSIVNMGFKRKK